MARNKNSKWEDSWLKFILEMLMMFLGLFFVAFLVFRLPKKAFASVFFCVMAMVIFCSDNSGIRKCVVKKLPRNFPFYKLIAKQRRTDDLLTELYKTCIYMCVLMYSIIRVLRGVFLAATIALVAMVIYRYIRYSDKIKFASKNQKNLSPTAMALIVPGFVFTLAGIENQEFTWFFLMLWIIISLVILLLFFMKTKEYKQKKKWSVALGFIACVFVVTFGSLSVANFVYDFSEPNEYRVKILDKWETSGRSTTYYFKITPWAGRGEPVDMTVDWYMFNEVDEGDTAIIYQSDGLLGVEWYELTIPDIE